MDINFKKTWLEDLRSGNYEQVEGSLRTDTNCFCAMGLLAKRIGLFNDLTGEDSGNTDAYYNGSLVEAALTPELLTMVGLSENEQAAIITMNDDDCADFDEIANYIEENL